MAVGEPKLHMVPNGPAHFETSESARYRWPYAPLLIFFWMIVLGWLITHGLGPDRLLISTHFAAVQSEIDPNLAPWFELTILPGIGEAKARRIVAHRVGASPSDSPVFREAADLDQVEGIGPITLRRISRELRFP